MQVDVVIVGAGSAGCILAERLSRSGRLRVLVVEAGGSDRRFMVRMPIGYGHSFYNPAVNWMYRSVPQPGLGGRVSYWPRGKVLGGSSSINAMVWVRGQRRDFDEWRDAGNPGWGFDDVLPHFRAVERFAGGGATRGTEGALGVVDAADAVHPLCETFLDAAEAAGFPRTPDYNGAAEEGVGVYQITVDRGIRASAATAFLRPAMRRPNVSVLTDAVVDRIVFDGRRAVGVELLRGDRRETVRAGQVVVAAGAVASPAILQRSGVGPATVLAAAGIAARHVLPVGEHLQDHLGMDYLYEATVPTMNAVLRSWAGRIALGARYVLTRTGPFALSVNQAGGFVRSMPGLNHVDTQLYFSPASYSRPTPGVRRLTLPDAFPGMMLGLSQCRPKSRGTVRIASADPHAAPLIDPNYLSDPDDLAELVRGCALLRRIAVQPAFRRVVVREVAPGPSIDGPEAIAADVRARAGSVFHASCTCRMAHDPADGVVDARLRVHGTEALRVIDASVFPSVTSGNTNAPTMMVADKGAAMALADWNA